MGSDRNRSMMPFLMSSASPAPVIVAPKMHGLGEDPRDEELLVGAALAP